MEKEEVSFDDPVIKAELEGKQQLPQPVFVPADGSHQPGDGDNYNTFEDAGRYPMGPDQYVRKQVEIDDFQQENEGRFFNIFKKLRGENERQDFLIKVLYILTFQVFLTVCFIGIVWANSAMKDYLQNNLWVYFTALVLTIVVLCAIICFRKIGRTVPYNYIALVLFTFFESIMLATITSFYDTKSVFISAALALVMFTTLVVISLSTQRSPKTVCAMFSVALVLSFAMIPFLLFASSRWAEILISGVGLTVAAIYVVIDIDMIVEKYGLGYDEYVFASIQLYLDLVMIFVYLLSLFGDRS